MAGPRERSLLPDPPKMERAKVWALLRRILLLARPEWPSLLLGTLFLGVGSLTGLVLPASIGNVVDGAFAPADRSALNTMTAQLFAVFLVMGVASALRYIIFTNAGERVVSRLRADLFGKLLSQEIGFFDGQRTGELTNRLASDTAVLQNSVSANISMTLRNLANVFGGLGMLFWTSPRLTFLMLSIVPAVALGAVFFGRRVRKLSRDVQDALAKASGVAEESLSSIRTVRAFAAEEHETGRYRELVEQSFQLAKARSRIAGTFFGGASFAAFASAAIVFWYGGGLVLDHQMTAGGLTSFLVYTMFVAMGLAAVVELSQDFLRAAGAAERIFELLDRVPQVPVSGGDSPAKVEGRVAYEKVSFAYPSRPDVTVLDGLELAIQPGEIVAVVGPSGAGKSTLASLLTRLYDPRDGRVTLDGRDLRELDPKWLRQQIGVVSQEPTLFSSSIGDNIRYGRMTATDAEVEAAAKAANAHEFISKFPEGYRTLVGERGVQLSGGQKQRVAIARALLKDPRLLILDEATSALDSESEHLVQEALERLLEGRTTLIIAHRLSTVMDADRVLVIEGGKIVQQGSHQALAGEEGLYRRLVERQFVAA